MKKNVFILMKKIQLMKKKISFPNGFDNWAETHFLVVENILQAYALDNDNFAVNEWNERGQGGLWLIARTLTDWFERKYKGEAWGDEKDWFDEIEKMFQDLYEHKTFKEWCEKNEVEHKL